MENQKIVKDNLNANIKKIDILIKKQFKHLKIPGLAIGILKDDKLIYSSCMGYANIEKKIPVTIDTVFRLASLTKMFTAIGIMQLWEKRKFNLDDPVDDYLHEGKIIPKKKKWPAVTFRHLLTHTSGVGELPGFSYLFKKNFGILINKGEKLPRLSSFHAKILKTSCPAGEKYAYSNIGFSLLGYLTEILTGERWEDYIKKNIMDPLGMTDSDMLPNNNIAEKEAVGYNFKRKKLKIAKYRLNIVAPAGNLYSNINDMMKFASMLLNEGRINEGRINDLGNQSIIKPETLNLMITPQYYTHEIYKDTIANGLCFRIGNINGKKIVEHTGANDGFTSAFTLIPEEKIGVCVFSNLNEIFKSYGTLAIKNLILRNLLEEENQSDPKIFINISSKRNFPSHPKNFKEYKGYFAPKPGILTNTRFYKSGGNLKVSSNKDCITISHLYGRGKKPTLFYPTDDPLIFKQNIENKFFPLQIAFEKNKNGKIAYLDLGFFKLRKISYFRTTRFLRICIIFIIGFSVYMILSLIV